jgi:hypothetical protein
MISLAVIQTMIHMPMETSRTMEPRARSEEYTTREPFWTIIAIRRASVRRSLIIPIRANRSYADVDRDLRVRLVSRSKQQTAEHHRYRQILESLHSFASSSESPEIHKGSE